MTKNEILSVLSGPKFGALGIDDKKDAIDGVLKYIYGLRGYTVADGMQAEIDSAVGIIEDRLTHRFPHLTVGEIKLALELGVTGFWTKDKRLTIANYLDWLAKYSSSPERAEAVEERIASQKSLTQSQASTLLPASDVAHLNEEAGRRAAQREFDAFCRVGHLEIMLQGYGAMIYDYLIKHGCFNPNDNAIRTAYERSKHTRSTYDEVTTRQERGFFGDMRTAVIRTARSINAKTTPVQHLLDWATKCELLSMYFATLKARGMQLQV